MLSNVQALQTYPHDPDAFTQGLEYQRVCNRTGCHEVFWESTGAAALGQLYSVICSTCGICDMINACLGLYGRSSVREVDVLTGKVLRQQALSRADFGEGLVRFGSRYVAE